MQFKFSATDGVETLKTFAMRQMEFTKSGCKKNEKSIGRKCWDYLNMSINRPVMKMKVAADKCGSRGFPEISDVEGAPGNRILHTTQFWLKPKIVNGNMMCYIFDGVHGKIL